MAPITRRGGLAGSWSAAILLCITCGVPSDTAMADLEGSLGRIIGAVWDPPTKRLVLVGDGDAKTRGLRPECLAAALLCVYNRQHVRALSFSLDPADPRKPDGSWMAAKYYLPPHLQRTESARIMYEADWLLKQYSFGLQVARGKSYPAGTKQFNIDMAREGVEIWSTGEARSFRLVPRQMKVAGFQSLPEMMLAQPGRAARALRARMWIVCDLMRLARTDSSFRFDQVKMGVRAKKQIIGPDGTLVDAASNDPLAKAFAMQFTRMYNGLAGECPAFAEIRELAKAIALAKWLRESRIPVDLDWARRALGEPVSVVQRVTQLRARKATTRRVPIGGGVRIDRHVATVSGGVDLTVKLTKAPTNDQAVSLERATRRSLASADRPRFSVPEGRRIWKATVLPFAAGGKRMWDGGGLKPQRGVAHGRITMPGRGPVESPSHPSRRDDPRRVRSSPILRDGGKGAPPSPPPTGQAEGPCVFLRGRTCNVALGKGKPTAWTGLWGDLAAARAGGPKAAEAQSRVVNGWRRIAGQLDQPGRRIVLVAHDRGGAGAGRQLGRILSRAHPGRTFVTTGRPERAWKNLRNLGPLRQGPDLNLRDLVFRPSFRDPEYRQATAHATRRGDWVDLKRAPSSIQDVGRKSNILLVAGDMNDALVRDIDAAGQQGKLNGKSVIIWACGKTQSHEVTLRMLSDYGVRLVWLPLHEIDARLVPYLQKALNMVIGRAPRTTAVDLMDNVIDTAIDRLEPHERIELAPKLKALKGGNLMSRRDALESGVVNELA